MTRHKPTADSERAAVNVLPHWERQRHRRLLLDQRVRAVRRHFLAGGVIGTVAFSALVGYATKGTATSNPTSTPVTETATTQSDAANFFSGQANTRLTSVIAADGPTATVTSVVMTGGAEAATAHTAKGDDDKEKHDGETHHSKKADDDDDDAHHATTTNITLVAPADLTATPSSAAPNIAAPSNPVPAQTHSRTHSSN